MKILVTGSTGAVGSRLVKALLAKGVDVCALVRRPSRLPEGVEQRVGDFLDPPSIRLALEGIDKLYLLNAVSADELTQGLIAVDIAKRQRLQHIVYHSVFRVERFLDVPHFASKLAIEQVLTAFKMPYTVLRPGFFFQNDEQLAGFITENGVYPMPIGERGIAAVDVRDVADAAATVLTSDGHEGKHYNIVGPSLLSGPLAAEIWSHHLCMQVRYDGEDFDAFEAQVHERMPAWAAFDMRTMFQGYVERGFEITDADVATTTQLLGRPPRRYEDFVREEARAWGFKPKPQPQPPP